MRPTELLYHALMQSEAQQRWPDWAGSGRVCQHRRSAAHRHQQPALWPGTVQAQIGLVDTGGYLASSTLYLVTNCTNEGVTGPGKITGNPISSSNPTGQQLTQNYSFNSSNNQQVQFTYDLSEAQDSGTLSITDGTTPSTGGYPPRSVNFQSTYLQRHLVCDRNCLVHTGELYNGSPACKLYTLTCQVGTNPEPKRSSVPGVAGTQRALSGSFRRSQFYPSRCCGHEWPDLPSGSRFPGGQRRLGWRVLRFRSSVQHRQ